jgi:hypothetical protein
MLQWTDFDFENKTVQNTIIYAQLISFETSFTQLLLKIKTPKNN